MLLNKRSYNRWHKIEPRPTKAAGGGRSSWSSKSFSSPLQRKQLPIAAATAAAILVCWRFRFSIPESLRLEVSVPSLLSLFGRKSPVSDVRSPGSSNDDVCSTYPRLFRRNRCCDPSGKQRRKNSVVSRKTIRLTEEIGTNREVHLSEGSFHKHGNSPTRSHKT